MKKRLPQDAKDLLGTVMPTGVPLILPEFPTAVKGKEDWEENDPQSVGQLPLR